MKKIKIAQVGIGHDHAFDTYKTIIKLSDYFEFVGFCVCEGEEERPTLERYDISKKMTLEEILNYPGLEAVAVECDDWNLSKYTIMCAEKGLHIHMDKPGGEDSDEFEKMLSIIKKNETVFQTGYMYRYNPVIISTFEKAKNGYYGDVYAVEAHMDCEHIAEKRDWLGRFKGGMMNYLGCHLLDVIVNIMGVPEEIIPMNMPTNIEGVTANDYGFAVLKYKNGISFAKTSAAEPGGYLRRQIVVCGSKGTCEIKPIEAFHDGKICTDFTETVSGRPWYEKQELQSVGGFDRYEKMMEDFAKYIRGEEVNPYTIEYEARLHRILLAACGYDIDYKSEIIL